MDAYVKEMGSFTIADSDSLAEKEDGIQIMLCGINAGYKEITTKRGERMAFFTLEDRHGAVEVVVFADVYQNSGHLLNSEDPLLVLGTIQKEETGVKIIAQQILNLLEAKEQLTQAIHVRLHLENLNKETLEDLKAILERHKGDCKAYLHLCTDSQCETVIKLGDKITVNPDRRLIEEVNRYFGGEVVTAILANGPRPLQSSRINGRNSRRKQWS